MLPLHYRDIIEFVSSCASLIATILPVFSLKLQTGQRYVVIVDTWRDHQSVLRISPHKVFEALLSQHLHLQNLVPQSGNDPLAYRLSSDCSTSELLGYNWCQGTGSNRPRTDFQSVALPTELPRQKFGVLDGERSHTIAFTEQCADHYTTNTIDWHRHMESNHNYQFRKLVYYPLYDGDIFGRGTRDRTQANRVKVCCATITQCPNNKTGCLFFN